MPILKLFKIHNKKNFTIGDTVTYNRIKYKLIRYIGEGGAKVAYEGIKVKNPSEKVVIFYPSSKYNEKTTKEIFEDEIEHLQMFMDKYQKKCVKNIICPIYLNKDKLVIITNYFRGKNLNEYMKDWHITWNQLLIIMKNIINAIYDLHSHGIIHMDLKPDNIMLDPNSLEIGIVDLGISCEKAKCSRVASATILYSPPETIKKGYEEGRDIWSLGCVFYELVITFITGKHETLISSSEHKRKPQFIKNKLEQLVQFKTDSDSYNQFLQLLFRMLEYDVKDRIRIDEIKKIIELIN